MISVLIILFLFFVFLMNVSAIYSIIKNKTPFTFYQQYILCLISVVLIPLFLFGYLVPRIVVDGEREIYTQVKYSKGNTYDVMVLFDIRHEEMEEGERLYYYPLAIHWSNGGESRNQLDDGGEIGDWVRLEDQEGKRYDVKITKASFTFSEQFLAIPLFDKIMYLFTFLSSAYLIYKYQIDLKNQW